MSELSESRMRHLIGKPWSAWNLPECSTDNDLAKLREVYKPKEPDKPADHCNLLPSSLMHLYGSRPDIEFFSVTRCAGCNYYIKTQWLSHHFKRDAHNNMVCRKTELIVSGSKSLGKATSSLHEIRESTRTPFIEISTSQASASPNLKPASNHTSESSIASSKSPTRSKSSSSSHKTESVASNVSSSSSSSKSKHNSHHQSKSKSSSSTSSSTSSSSKSKSSSSSSSKSTSGSSSSSTSWSASKSGSSRSSSHKPSPSPGTYTLSIPSDDIGQNESVESILLSNSAVGSKHTMHIIATSTATGKSKSGDTEYEQLKFYADSADKKSKPSSNETESKGTSHKLVNTSFHVNSDGSHFKIPSKSKSSSSVHSSSGSHASMDSNKKSKTSQSSSHTSQSKSTQDLSSSKVVFRSSSSSSESTKSLPVSSISSTSESKTKGESNSSSSSNTHDVKEKSSSHSKKKKKKKDKDEPRKVIPLKDRAFHPDHHCGVSLPEESNPCTRSLTCKTHSIALRRAVPGRSHPFDSLLAAHKKARDEEKNSKAREHGDDSKSKSKKSSSQSSSTPEAIVISSSHTIGAGKAITVAPAASSSKGNGTFLAPVAVPVALPAGPSISIRNITDASSSVVSKHGISQNQMQRSSKPAKSSSKPVVVVEERTEDPGLSLFDIARVSENVVYVTSIKGPRSSTDSKVVDGKRGGTALSEWNPLDRLSKKDRTPKKKHVKELLVPIPTRRIIETFKETSVSNSRFRHRKLLLEDPVLKPTDKQASDHQATPHKTTKRKLNLVDDRSVAPIKVRRMTTPKGQSFWKIVQCEPQCAIPHSSPFEDDKESMECGLTRTTVVTIRNKPPRRRRHRNKITGKYIPQHPEP